MVQAQSRDDKGTLLVCIMIILGKGRVRMRYVCAFVAGPNARVPFR